MLSVIIGFASLVVAVFAAGAGHGTYLPAIALFPYTMLSAIFVGTISSPLVIMAALQFPIYGGVLVLAGDDRNVPVSLVVAGVHLVAVVGCLAYAGDTFR